MIGGIGNNLWIYASVFGIGRMTNREVRLCSGRAKVIMKMFPHLSIKVAESPTCARNSSVRPDGTVRLYDHSALYFDLELIHKIRDTQNHVSVCCYLQNLGYILGMEEEIRKEFTLAESFQSLAQERLEKLCMIRAGQINARLSRNITNGKLLLNGTAPVFVTVHVRRGNMLKEEGVVVPNESHHLRGMEYFRKKYANVLFIVASDGMKWCKEHLKGEDVFYSSDLGVNNTQDEFALAVSTNHTVTSVGTFGWWMGFLAGGDVVYFKNWAYGHRWSKWYLPGQRYPYNWIPL